MPNYKNAVIYKLCCKDPTITDEYIGSTCNKDKRKFDHKSNCNNENKKYNFPVYQCIRANNGFENWDMIVIEPYPCNNKDELHMRERYWIEERRPTLNKQIPTRTYKEYVEKHKDFYKQYHEEYSKKYREELTKYSKKYRKENKEKIGKQKKQYYKKNKDEILERNKTKYICECGSEIRYSDKSRHLKTKKHLKYLEELKELNDLKEDN